MKTKEALEVVRALANGENPLSKSGERLPADSIYNDAHVTRALFVALIALERLERLEGRASRLPGKAGHAWGIEEEGRLSTAFDEGKSIPALAAEFSRSPTAIRARLVKLGKLEGADWYTE